MLNKYSSRACELSINMEAARVRQTIVVEHINLGVSTATLACILGISTERVRQIYRRGVKNKAKGLRMTTAKPSLMVSRKESYENSWRY